MVAVEHDITSVCMGNTLQDTIPVTEMALDWNDFHQEACLVELTCNHVNAEGAVRKFYSLGMQSVGAYFSPICSIL